MKYEYSLPEALKIREWTEMMSAIETARHKDHEHKMKQMQRK